MIDLMYSVILAEILFILVVCVIISIQKIISFIENSIANYKATFIRETGARNPFGLYNNFEKKLYITSKKQWWNKGEFK